MVYVLFVFLEDGVYVFLLVILEEFVSFVDDGVVEMMECEDVRLVDEIS